MTAVWPYVAALIPTAGVVFLFYVIVKNMMEGDRRERLAHSQWLAEEDRRKAAADAARDCDSSGSE